MTDDLTERSIITSDIGEFFLARRLSRVDSEHLTTFLENEVNATTADLDNKTSIIEKFLVFHRLASSNADKVLKNKYDTFFRDYLLTSNRSEHILELENPEDKVNLINWIKTWDKDGLVGVNYTFYMHGHHQLEEMKVEFEDGDSMYFPTEALLMVAKYKNPTYIPNGYDMISYYPTKEFEIIFRKDLNYIEVRGDYKVIQDFVNTCLNNVTGIFKDASGIFIGNTNRKRKILGLNKIKTDVSIDNLKRALHGKYLKISAKVDGSTVVKIAMVFDSNKDAEEETNSDLKDLYHKIVQNPDTGSITFDHNRGKISFKVTNKGALNFSQYVPEEVITFVLHKIIRLQKGLYDLS